MPNENKNFTTIDAIKQFDEARHMPHYIETLIKSGLSKENIVSILKRAQNIIETLGTKPAGKKGLLVGKVQSGKTNSFTSTIAVAFQFSYNIAIVLSGRDNVLNKQTFERIKNMFFKDDFSTGVNVYQVKEVLNEFDNKTFIDEIKNNLVKKHKYIFISLKNQQIEKLLKLLSVPALDNGKFLIIDDEGDLASFNVSENLNEESKTYKMICNMLEELNIRSSYLSVTATPQAHILLQKNAYIKPDYIFTIDPGNEYMGLNEYFGEDWKKYIKIVPEQEKTAIENNKEETPNSFKESILYYITACALFHLENKKIRQTTMLCHTAKEVSRHNLIAKKINAYKKTIHRILTTSGTEQNFINEKIKKIVYEYNPDFQWNDNFINLFLKHLDNCSINIVNSEIEDPLYKNTPNNIVIGSQMVERGVTFKNLLTTYITNRSEDMLAIDTALQRGRWFGYRKKYKHLIKIFMLERMVINFRDQILKHDNQLWNILDSAYKTKQPFNEIERKLSIESNDLIATNKVKHHKITFKQYLYNPNVILNNSINKLLNIIFDYVKNHKNLQNKNIGDANILYIKKINFQEFKKKINLEKNYKYFATSLNLSIDNYKILEKTILNKKEIILAINEDVKIIDKTKLSCKKINFFIEKTIKHIGNKNWFDFPEFNNNLIFQIHKFNIENKTKKFFSLISPKKLISSIVIGE